MTAYDLKPWTKVATPHDDILKGDLELSTYAANLGHVDDQAKTCPVVYRDAVTFFRATYRTTALDELLQGVARVLAGESGNRVLQLRTPFGGGKTHTLIGLLHLVRHRNLLDKEGLVDGYPNPGADARVAVLPCLDFNAASGRNVEGLHIRTLWGELAYRLGGREAYEQVRESDEARVNPGGSTLKNLLDGRPTLILLDEVLTYVEAALGVGLGGKDDKSGDTNLGRQTMLFLQHLTEVVRGLQHGAVVYSLQQSVREAVGDELLLETLDQLVSRLDAKKEPVTGDEVLKVVQRRLFKDIGDDGVRKQVAKEYAAGLQRYLEATAQTQSEKRAAADQAAALERRILDAYPFHPELLDLMYHRWGSLPTYQRTRGALQFLATCISALWRAAEKGEAISPLIGPGDVPLVDGMVRNTFFSQVGEREAMKSVLDSDLLGSTARCLKVDEQVAADSPGYRGARVGTRLTRALALYSFGAKPGEDRGVLRTDLLAAVQSPEVPAEVFDPALDTLAETLLYIHTGGRRFRFEKKPNLNKLIDDEARKIEVTEVLTGIRKAFEGALKGRNVVIWPKESGAVPDRKPYVQFVFMAPDHALDTADVQVSTTKEWTESCGGSKRQYRNGVVFLFPSAGPVEAARNAARRMLAVARLVEDKGRHRFDADDLSDLKARERRAETDLQAAVRQLYPTILLPVAAPPDAQEPVRIERVEVPSFQALGGGILEAVHRVLDTWVFEHAVPGKLVSCVRLGDGDMGTRAHWISGPELVDQFYGSVHFPKLLTVEGLKKSVADGASRGTFGYVMGGSDDDGKLKLLQPEALSFKRDLQPDDVDLSAGSFVISAATAKALVVEVKKAEGRTTSMEGAPVELPPGGGDTTVTVSGGGDDDMQPGEGEGGPSPTFSEHEVRLRFRTDGSQLFKAFGALQNLSEWADDEFAVKVDIYAKGKKKLDRNWYEMSVLMPLDEEDIDVDK